MLLLATVSPESYFSIHKLLAPFQRFSQKLLVSAEIESKPNTFYNQLYEGLLRFFVYFQNYSCRVKTLQK